MPTYDYECAQCGHRFELRQGFGADRIQVCPECSGEAHRKLHSVAVIYKGDGFYTTDYARKPLNEAGKSLNESGDSESEGTSDTPE